MRLRDKLAIAVMEPKTIAQRIYGLASTGDDPEQLAYLVRKHGTCIGRAYMGGF